MASKQKVFVEAVKDIQLGPITKRELPDGKVVVDDYTKLYKEGDQFWVDADVFAAHDSRKVREVKGKKGFVIASIHGALKLVNAAPQGQVVPSMASEVDAGPEPVVVPDKQEEI